MSDDVEFSKAELLRRIAAGRREFDALIDSLNEQQLTRPGPEGWSVKDHLAHLAMWEAGVAALLRREPRWEAMGVDAETVARNYEGDDDEDGINAIIHRQTKGLSLAEVKELFARAQRELTDAVEVMAEEDFHKTYRAFQPDLPSDSGNPIWPVVVGNTYGHYAEHAEWIRELLAKQQA